MKNYRFIIQGLDCANCAKKIEDKIASLKGYEAVVVNFSTSTLSFKTDESEEVEKTVRNIVNSVEPEAKVIEKTRKKIEEVQRSNKDIFRLTLGIMIYLVGTYFPFNTFVSRGLIIVAVLILLYKTARKAVKQLKHKIVDENSLIVLSVIGACAIGKIMEGVMVITLYEIGKILEAKAVGKTRNSISKLMDIKPEYANLKTKDGIKEVSPEEVKIGEIIVVKTGEKIPLDGVVIKGEAELNNAALTGESMPVRVIAGEKVLSGGINTNGLIEVKVELTYENSTANKILNLVENATDKKAKTETMVSRLARIYTPTVFVFAMLVWIIMPWIVKNVTYTQSFYKALTFLVISCPCSIAISVPLSYFSGIGKASKSGILVKGSNYLDGLKDIKKMMFDKTGTITTGTFSVSKIEVIDVAYTKEEILNYFAIGESFSNHPIAKSILEKVGKGVDTAKVEKLKELAGKGIEYFYEGKEIRLGNQSFVGIKKKEETYGTVLYLSINQKVIGKIILSDTIKKDAKMAIEKLHKLGIKTKMLTGDNQKVAEEVANKIGIDEVSYEMLPQAKYEEVEKELQETKGKLAFVGDGINDSPVLARSDIGISMGGIGSSAAIEASDVVIMTDELSKIIEGIEISKKTNRIIKQNLIFAIGIKILVLVLSIFGVATMWQAVFADVGTTLITILNTIRILK